MILTLQKTGPCYNHLMTYKVLVWNLLDLPDMDNTKAVDPLEPVTTKMNKDINELSAAGWTFAELIQDPSVDHLIVILKRENFLQRLWSSVEHLEYHIVNWSDVSGIDKHIEERKKDGWVLRGLYKLNKPWRWITLMKRRTTNFHPNHDSDIHSMFYMYGMR
jgi:hypothetical protein